jgi:hypothetical protein
MVPYGWICGAAMLASAGTALGEELVGTWRFCHGPEFPGAAGQLAVDSDRLTLHYDFRGGGNYVAAYCDLAEPQFLRTIRFRLRKPPEATITIRVFDAAGQCFQKSFSYEDSREREIEVNLRGWAAHWGGPNDGVLRPPLHTVGVLVERQGLSRDQGSIALSVPTGEPMPEAEQAELAAVPASTLRSYLVTDFGPDCVLASSAGDALRDGIWRIDWARSQQVSLGGSLSLFHRPNTLTVRAKASAPGATLAIHIGAHFQNFQRTVGVLDGTDQTFHFTLPPDGWEATGAAHQTLHYPLRITRIVVDRAECQAERLEIALHEMTCETTVDPSAAAVLMSQLSAAPPRDGARALTLTGSGWNLLDTALSGALHVQVKTWDGTLLHEAALPVELTGGGKRHTIEHAFSVPADLRYVETHCRFESPGQRAAEASSTLTAPLGETTFAERLPDPDRSLRPDSPWGMGVYLYRYPHSPSGLRQMDRAAELAAAAGVKWTREEFNYGMIEKAPRVYDFTFFDQLVDTAQRHGISVYALLSYWSPFVAPYTEEGIDAYCDYARATVRRFKDRIKHWEIYNEPNIFFWDGPKELYPVLLRRAYHAIKEEDPDARVLGISTAGIDRPFIRMVLESGAPFDDLTIHPYRGQLIERNFIRELQQAADQVQNRPVWITEMGWSTQIGGGGKSEREQAQLLARSYLAGVGAGVRNMGWYNFRNDGDDPFYNESNFGVLRRDLSPKAAYRALATVCRTLAVTDDITPAWLEHGAGEHGLFALAVGGRAALWAPHADLDVVVATGGTDGEFLNLMGEPIDPRHPETSSASSMGKLPETPAHAARDGSPTFTITLRQGDPIFFLGDEFRIVSAAPSARDADDQELLRF